MTEIHKFMIANPNYRVEIVFAAMGFLADLVNNDGDIIGPSPGDSPEKALEALSNRLVWCEYDQFVVR